MNRLLLLLFGTMTFVAHAQVPDYVPTEGLVAWYPFNGNADDASGNGHDGDANGIAMTADRFNLDSSALQFVGENHIAIDSNLDDFNFQGDFTITCWAKWNSSTIENYSRIISKDLGAHPSYGSYQIITGAGDSLDYCGGTLRTPEAYKWTRHAGGQAAGNWRFIKYSRNGEEICISENLGDNVCKSISGEVLYENLPLHIGGGLNGYGEATYFNGCIDEVGFWNRALTESEILALYNAETPGPGCTDPTACNYNAAATSDDGNCIFADYGQDCDGNCLGGTHWYVDSNASGDVTTGEPENPFPNIQDALDRACPNDTIHIASGTYLENVNVTTPGLTMIGDEEFDVLQSDQTTVVVDANNAGSGLVIDAEGTHIMGLTFTNGHATHGGAVYATSNGSNSILDRCAIINNSGLDLVTSYAHNLQFEQCAVLFNSGRNTIVPWNTASFNRCRIQNNTTPDNSNAILAAGENTQIVNCLIGPNVSKGVYAYGASLLVEHTTITGHTWGCAVDASLSDAAMFLVNSVVTANDGDIIVNQSGNNLAQFHFAACILDDSLNYSWESAYSTIEEYGTNYIQPALLEEDFSLASNSPAIGVAISELTWSGPAPHEPTIDLSGAARPQPAGTAADLGAFEHPLGFPEPTFGCTDEMSCNFNPSATDDDGSCIAPTCDDPSACNYDSDAVCGGGECIPSGCMEPLACNYNALAECNGEPCNYTCCPGPGCCADGTSWDYDLEQCVSTCPEGASCPHDLDFDGVVGVGDLMNLLTMFGTYCPTIFTSGDSMN